MRAKTRRFILWNAFLYLICLCLALKIKDVASVGPYATEIGLSKLNIGFRNLWHYNTEFGYSKPWFTLGMILNFICIVNCVFWIGMLVREVIKSGRLDGVGTDKNYFATVFLYIAALISSLLLKAFKINYGPVPGHLVISASFPSVPVLIYIVSIGSAVFHIWALFGEKKKLCIAVSVFGTVLMLIGIIAVAASGICWFTDILGSILLGIVLMMLYTFFFDAE